MLALKRWSLHNNTKTALRALDHGDDHCFKRSLWRRIGRIGTRSRLAVRGPAPHHACASLRRNHTVHNLPGPQMPHSMS
jgi:hypothetical protein